MRLHPHLRLTWGNWDYMAWALNEAIMSAIAGKPAFDNDRNGANI